LLYVQLAKNGKQTSTPGGIPLTLRNAVTLFPCLEPECHSACQPALVRHSFRSSSRAALQWRPPSPSFDRPPVAVSMRITAPNTCCQSPPPCPTQSGPGPSLLLAEMTRSTALAKRL